MDVDSDKLFRMILHEHNEDIIKLLDEFEQDGMDINKLAEHGKTVLMFACERGRMTIVEKLLEMGSNVNAVDSKNNTALCYAASAGKSDCVIALCRDPGLDPNIARNEDAHKGETPLMYACWKCSPEAVQAILSRGVDVNAQSRVKEHYTALMYALYNVHGAKAAKEIIHMLLDAGADIDVLDIDKDAVYNNPAFEAVRKANGKHLNTAKAYRNRKRAMTIMKRTVKRAMSRRRTKINFSPPYGNEYLKLLNKYTKHPIFDNR